ncbi:MAG: hypothetical protein E7047_10285 [Lentisphaerae bacterium]|nr:hypothetical protein [Lentisphaerota bacterium]
MKKHLLLTGAAAAAALALTGCVGVPTHNGAPAAFVGAPSFYAQVSGNAMMQPNAPAKYTVVKRNVQAKTVVKSYFGCVSMGDSSFATLKAEALKSAPGANDIIDVKMDYSMTNVIGICETTITMTGTAVKY